MAELQSYERVAKKPLFKSINESLFLLYLFVSVNDIFLLPFGFLWIKNALLVFLSIGVLIQLPFKRIEYSIYLFIVSLLFLVSISVSAIYQNIFDYVVQESFALLVTLIVPILMLAFINTNIRLIVNIATVFMFAIFFATVHKLLYVIYLQNYISGGILDFLYENLSGRGQVDGMDRLNTGNQLLVSLAALMAYRFFAIGYKRGVMLFMMLVCALNIFLTASVFFTTTTLLLIGIFILLNNGSNVFSRILFACLMAMLSYFLANDLFSAREASGMVDDGNIYRIVQAEKLYEYFLSAPLFGNGPGFAIYDLGNELPWFFENQVAVIFAKYGIFGFLSFIALLVLQFKIFKYSLSLFYYLILIGFIFIASIFNPYLFGSYAAWAFSISLVLAYLLKNDNINYFLFLCAAKRAG